MAEANSRSPMRTAGQMLKPILAAAVLALAFLAMMSGSAAAITTHTLDHSIDVGPSCGGGSQAAGDLAYVESTQLIYVLCPGQGFTSVPEIRRFDIDGNPVPFTADGDYLSGNTLTGTPDPSSPNGQFGYPSTIAVDNSSVHNGYLYVASYWGPANINIFDPTGRWVGSIPTPGNAGVPMSVCVDRQGYIYAGSSAGFGRGHISKFDPSFHEILRIFQDDREWAYIRPDS